CRRAAGGAAHDSVRETQHITRTTSAVRSPRAACPSPTRRLPPLTIDGGCTPAAARAACVARGGRGARGTLRAVKPTGCEHIPRGPRETAAHWQRRPPPYGKGDRDSLALARRAARRRRRPAAAVAATQDDPAASATPHWKRRDHTVRRR